VLIVCFLFGSWGRRVKKSIKRAAARNLQIAGESARKHFSVRTCLEWTISQFPAAPKLRTPLLFILLLLLWHLVRAKLKFMSNWLPDRNGAESKLKISSIVSKMISTLFIFVAVPGKNKEKCFFVFLEKQSENLKFYDVSLSPRINKLFYFSCLIFDFCLLLSHKIKYLKALNNFFCLSYNDEKFKTCMKD